MPWLLLREPVTRQIAHCGTVFAISLQLNQPGHGSADFCKFNVVAIGHAAARRIQRLFPASRMHRVLAVEARGARRKSAADVSTRAEP